MKRLFSFMAILITIMGIIAAATTTAATKSGNTYAATAAIAATEAGIGISETNNAATTAATTVKRDTNNAATTAATTAPPQFRGENNAANGEMKRKPASPSNSSTVTTTTVEATFLGLTKDQWLLTGIFIIVCVIGFFSQKANADAFLRNKASDSN